MIRITAQSPLKPYNNTTSEAITSSEKENMWDTFEHVLLFISLYVFATSFTLILHEFINVLVPNSTSQASPAAQVSGQMVPEQQWLQVVNLFILH